MSVRCRDTNAGNGFGMRLDVMAHATIKLASNCVTVAVDMRMASITCASVLPTRCMGRAFQGLFDGSLIVASA